MGGAGEGCRVRAVGREDGVVHTACKSPPAYGNGGHGDGNGGHGDGNGAHGDGARSSATNC